MQTKNCTPFPTKNICIEESEIEREKIRGIWRRGSGIGDHGGRSLRHWGGERHGDSGVQERGPEPACKCRRDRWWKQQPYRRRILRRSTSACWRSHAPLRAASLFALLSSSSSSSSFLILMEEENVEGKLETEEVGFFEFKVQWFWGFASFIGRQGTNEREAFVYFIKI